MSHHHHHHENCDHHHHDEEEQELAKFNELEEQLKEARQKGEKAKEADVLHELTDLILDVVADVEKAIEYANAEILLRKELNQEDKLSLAFGSLGMAYMHMEENQKARPIFEESLELAKKSASQDALASAYVNITSLYLSLYNEEVDFEHEEDEEEGEEEGEEEKEQEERQISEETKQLLHKAIEYGKAGLALCENGQLNQSEMALSCICLVSEAYHALEEYENALEYSKKSLELSQKRGNSEEIGEALFDVAQLHQEIAEAFLEKSAEEDAELDEKHRGHIDSAIKYFEELKSVAEKEDNDQGIYDAFNGLADCYYILKNHEKVVESYKAVLAAAEKYEDESQQMQTLFALGEYLEESGHAEEAAQYITRAEEVGKQLMGDEDDEEEEEEELSAELSKALTKALRRR